MRYEGRDASSPKGDPPLSSEIPQVFNALRDELFKMPVCEESVCTGEQRHVDVFSAANFADDQFELFDSNSDRFISDKEIVEYETNFGATMTERMRQHIQFLKTNYAMISNLHNDEWGPENDGMTVKDLDVLEDKEDGQEAYVHIREIEKDHFSKIDADGNGRITHAEINAFANGRPMEHPVRDRDALRILSHLSEGRNYSRAIGDWIGMTDYRNSGRGLTRAQVMQSAELVKDGVEAHVSPFYMLDIK